jgi:hypothetical protein
MIEGQQWVASEMVAFLDKRAVRSEHSDVVAVAKMYASAWNEAGIALKQYEPEKAKE